MRRSRIRLLALVLAGAAVAAPFAQAQRRGYRLQLDGYLGPPPAGKREQADLTLRCGTQDHRFQVTKATILSGSALASEVLDRVAPYKPNFILRAPDEILNKLTEAKPGARLRITGQWRQGTRDLLVGGIEPLP